MDHLTNRDQFAHQGRSEPARRPAGGGVTRRGALAGAAAAGTVLLAAPTVVRAQAPTRIRIGHAQLGMAVNSQMWAASYLGAWKRVGLEPEFFPFATGLENFQAMIGGSIDVLSTGAVISNFPARGQGRVFLINSVEWATTSLWVRPDQGVSSFQDLKGKRISTTRGTTADIFLNNALANNGLSYGDVEVINQRMTEAVTSFISGAVPAVSLWTPLDLTVSKQVPGAKKLADASQFYPKAAVLTGWAAMAPYMERNRDTLRRLVDAWRMGNELMTTKTEEGLAYIQEKEMRQVSLDEVKAQYQAQKMFPAEEWRGLYQDGTVNRWLDQVTEFFAKNGPIPNPVMSDRYFDKSIFLDAVRG